MKPQYLLNLVSDHVRSLPLLVLYLTDGCNSRCVTCDIWLNPRRNMSRALVDQLVNDAEALGTRWVLLSGGEAMQHPHWPEIAGRFKNAGMHVMLLTNGLYLRKQVDALVGAVDEVIVSLDGGTAQTYEAIRGVDGFEVVMEGIRATRALGIPVATRTTIQRANWRELPTIIDVAKAADVNRISFLTVDVSNKHAFGPRFSNDVTLIKQDDAPHSSSAIPAEDLQGFSNVIEDIGIRYATDFASGLMAESLPKLRQMATYFAAIQGQAAYPRPRCNSPHTSVVVEVDGTVRPCYFLPSIGKIRSDLPSTLNSTEALHMRKAYRTGQRPECECCVCPLYKGPRSLLRM
jgi:MoaA/NifB/PqqE/SkfB family radical SAM enzyme